MLNKEFKYAVVRYMLNDLADEGANVGLVAVADDPPRMLCKFIDNPTAKSRNDVRIQKEIVERFAAFVGERKKQYDTTREHRTASAVLEQIGEFGSGIVRTNMIRSVLTNDMEAEFKVLFDQWVQPHPDHVSKPRAPRTPLSGLNRRATTALVKAFRLGYGPLHHEMFRRQYSVQGQIHKNFIDLAMFTPKREHLFQHVLLLPDAEQTFTQAAGLCCRWEDIRQTNQVRRDMTAVLYDRAAQHVRGLNDATALLKKSDITVARLQDVPRLAEQLKAQPNLIPG